MAHPLFSSSFPIPHSLFLIPLQLFKLSSKTHTCSFPHHNSSTPGWANCTFSQSHTHPLPWISEFRFIVESIRFFYWFRAPGYCSLPFRQVARSALSLRFRVLSFLPLPHSLHSTLYTLPLTTLHREPDQSPTLRSPAPRGIAPTRREKTPAPINPKMASPLVSAERPIRLAKSL